MDDWIEHTGGPQPVGDDVWICIDAMPEEMEEVGAGYARLPKQVGSWKHVTGFFVFNQHLIDAKQAEIDQLKAKIVALQREVRLLGAACEWNRKFGALVQSGMPGVELARLEGIRLGLEAADKAVSEVTISFRSAPSVAALRLMKHVQIDCVAVIRNLNPDTIAREAQDMGSEKEAKDD